MTDRKPDAEATIEFCILSAIAETHRLHPETQVERIKERLFGPSTIWAIREYLKLAEDAITDAEQSYKHINRL